MVNISGKIMDCLNEEFKKDREIVLEAVKTNSDLKLYASIESPCPILDE